MPSTVASLFAAAEVDRGGNVPWSRRIPVQDDGPGTGVYVVALTPDPHTVAGALRTCPHSAAAVQELLDARPELKLDRTRPSVAELAARLAGFWCADEVVLYIGRAGPRRDVRVSEISDRVGEYYTTPLGARSPHAGGWPLKTLANLRELHVHFSYCVADLAAEQAMLDHFAERLSSSTREALFDATFVMPFANLEDARKRRKLHGITGARAPRKLQRPQPPGRPASPTRVRRATAPPMRPAESESARDDSADISAPELARRLGANPKTLRAWLRSQARAGNLLVAGHEHNGRWWFTVAEACELAEQFRRRR